MHDRKAVLILMLGLFCTGAVAQESRTTTVTQTTTIVKETVVSETKRWSPFKVCVLDFATLDTQGQKRFLDEKNNPITIPAQCTLNESDRKSLNSVMQGFVRMIDALDNTKNNEANRDAQICDNTFNREKALSLYNTTIHGQTRPMVMGADYLSAYLGRHNDVFSCIDTSLMIAAMDKLQKSPEFPRNFLLYLAKETGATHLIYGTVSDMRTKTNSFKGYGIETKTTNYQLDVIIKMVDLAAQKIVYSNVYTGNYREQRPISGTQFDDNIFQNLMTAALEQAAEDLYEQCRPGRKNKICVTQRPFIVTVIPSGDKSFKAADAEIFINGIRVGNGGISYVLPAGKHTIEIKASGYKTKSICVNVAADQHLNIKLEK